jgi:hypothetical protein
MGSLIEELRRPEAAARAEADRLRSRIQELSEDLARAEEQASRPHIPAPALPRLQYSHSRAREWPVRTIARLPCRSAPSAPAGARGVAARTGSGVPAALWARARALPVAGSMWSVPPVRSS